jgi:hypothetical protein
MVQQLIKWNFCKRNSTIENIYEKLFVFDSQAENIREVTGNSKIEVMNR